MKTILCVAILQLCLVSPILANTLQPVKISDNVYVLNANVGVVIGEKEVLLIDTWLGYFDEKAHQLLLQEVSSLTDKPIKYAINTHSHGDHSGGNKLLIEQGVTVINHLNSVYSSFIPKSGRPLPELHFDNYLQVNLGNEEITAQHVVSHTFDDALIYLKHNNVLFTGDNLITKFWAGLGVFGLESFNHWIDTALATINENTLIIPGHGTSFINRQQLIRYKADVLAWVEHMQSLYDQGLTAKQMTEEQKAQQLFAKLILDAEKKKTFSLYNAQKLINEQLAKPMPLKQAELEHYIGQYTFPNHNNIVIEWYQNKLVAKQKDKFYSYLKPLTRKRFELVNLDGGAILEFDFNQINQPVGFTPIVAKNSYYQSLKTGKWQKQ